VPCVDLQGGAFGPRPDVHPLDTRDTEGYCGKLQKLQWKWYEENGCSHRQNRGSFY